MHFDRERRLRVGPRRAMPLSLLAERHPEVLIDLRELASAGRLPLYAGHFAVRNPGCDPGTRLDRLEQRVWDALAESPRRLGEVARSAQGVDALRRLVDRGLATHAAFTPSDAMHVLGRQHGWNVEAARLGAAVLAVEERNASGRTRTDTPEELCERTYEYVIAGAVRAVLESALAHDPGIEVRGGHWGPLGALIEDVVAGRKFSSLLDARIHLVTPLIAVGAPVGAYYPEVARRLGTELRLPEHAAVCNAVGAVAGVVSEAREVLVNQPALKVFRVHDPAGIRDYPEAQAAIEDARRISRELALAAARRAGASDPHVETSVIERRAQTGPDEEYLAEAVVRSRATGRPATGHER